MSLRELTDGPTAWGLRTLLAIGPLALVGGAGNLGESLRLTVLATLLFLLPGYALAVVFLPRQRWSLGERLIAAPVLSVVFYPLMLYLGWLTGLRLDAWRAGFILAACGAVAYHAGAAVTFASWAGR